MKAMTRFLIIMLIPILVVSLWDSVPIIKTIVKGILDPTAGALLSWNLVAGFLIVVFIITFLTSLSQKYLSDQETLKELKKQQKEIREQMKKLERSSPQFMDLAKKQLELTPKMMEITTKPMAYTIIPLILLYRWFYEELHPVWGGWWILYYLLASMIFSMILKKVMKIA